MYNMRLKNREVKDRKEIDRIISQCDVVRVGLSVDNRPYIVPMNFGYDGKSFYFHGAKEGRKIDMIRVNPKVCFELDTDHRLIGDSDRACDWTMKYDSVMGTGTMHIIDEGAEKRKALNILMQQYGGEDAYDYEDKMIERIGILRLDVETVNGKRSK